MQLKTDYKDFEFTSGETLRKYRMINNPDGTVSFQDVTDYQAIGDRISASDLNTSNNEINAKADQEATNNALNNKADKTTVTNLQDNKADKSQLGDQVTFQLSGNTLYIRRK